MSLVLGGLFHFFSGPCSLQYKAERLGWSDSLLLQTEAVLISDYCREQIDYRYVLYMTLLQKTQTIPLSSGSSCGLDGLEIKFFKLASHVLSFPWLIYLIYL